MRTIIDLHTEWRLLETEWGCFLQQRNAGVSKKWRGHVWKTVKRFKGLEEALIEWDTPKIVYPGFKRPH